MCYNALAKGVIFMAKDLYIAALLDTYGFFLSEKQRDLVALYYNEDLSLSEIAENEGTSRQAVSEIIKRAEQQMREFEQACGYCKKLGRLKDLAPLFKEDASSLDEAISIIENI